MSVKLYALKSDDFEILMHIFLMHKS